MHGNYYNQLQFVMFKILTYKYLNRNNIKNMLNSLEEKKKQQISKQFNLYGKLTKTKFNFESNLYGLFILNFSFST